MLAVKNLKAGYDGKSVVSIPSLHVEKGGRCLVAGASGCGKTTLLYALAGLTDVIDGSVTINGTDLATLSPRQRDAFRAAHIGIIFQTLHLVKSLTVMDNIRLAPYAAHGAQDEIWALHLLNALGISHLQQRKATDVSQGQAQRIAIVRALMNKPALLLADEPTSSLDDVAAIQVAQLLTALAAEAGTALIVCTHDARLDSAFTQKLPLTPMAREAA